MNANCNVKKDIKKNILNALMLSAFKQGMITEVEYRRMVALSNKQ